MLWKEGNFLFESTFWTDGWLYSIPVNAGGQISHLVGGGALCGVASHVVMYAVLQHQHKRSTCRFLDRDVIRASIMYRDYLIDM